MTSSSSPTILPDEASNSDTDGLQTPDSEFTLVNQEPTEQQTPELSTKAIVQAPWPSGDQVLTPQNYLDWKDRITLTLLFLNLSEEDFSTITSDGQRALSLCIRGSLGKRIANAVPEWTPLPELFSAIKLAVRGNLETAQLGYHMEVKAFDWRDGDTFKSLVSRHQDLMALAPVYEVKLDDVAKIASLLVPVQKWLPLIRSGVTTRDYFEFVRYLGMFTDVAALSGKYTAHREKGGAKKE